MTKTPNTSIPSSSPSHSTTNHNTNMYLLQLSEELLHLCLQQTTSCGTLASGGLGIWTLLQYQQSLSSCATNIKERIKLLKSAKDAAVEVLQQEYNESTIRNEERIDEVSLNQPISTKSISLYTNTILGCHTVLAAIYYQLSLHDKEEYMRYEDEKVYHSTQVLKYIQSHTDANIEQDCSVWNGVAGAIQTIYFIRQHISDSSFGQTLVIQLAKYLLQVGRINAKEYHQRHSKTSGIENQAVSETSSTITSPSLVWKSTIGISSCNQNDYNTYYYLGAGYGMIGILNTLLGLSKEEWDYIENDVSEERNEMEAADIYGSGLELVKQSIDFLLTNNKQCHYVASGNLRIELDTSLTEIDRNHNNWMYGTTGEILLYLSAYQVFGPQHDKYLQNAIQLAEQHIWSKRTISTKQGLGVVNGIVGNAYVLYRLSQILQHQQQDDKNNIAYYRVWKERANHLAKHVVNHWREIMNMSPSSSLEIQQGQSKHAQYSLMEGLGGLVSLMIDLKQSNDEGTMEVLQFPLYYLPPLQLSNIRNKETIESKGPIVLMDEQETKSFANCNIKIQASLTQQNPQKLRYKDVVVTPETKSEKAESPTLKLKESSLISQNGHKHQYDSADTLDEEERKQLLNKLLTDNDSEDTDSLLEFESPDDNELPDKRYLRVLDSEDDGALFYGQDGSAMNPNVLDEGEHSVLPLQQKNGISNVNDVQGVLEFMSSHQNEGPDERYLQSQDPNKASEEHYTVDRKVNPPLLDEEEHKAEENYGDACSSIGDRDSEFQMPEAEDMPNEAFLRMQDSNDQLFFAHDGMIKPLLDEEDHHFLVRAVSDDEDVDDFMDSAEQDLPDENFLRKQDSADELYFDYEENQPPHSLLDEEVHPPHAVDTQQQISQESEISDEEFSQQDYTMEPYRPPLPNSIMNENDEFESPDDIEGPDFEYMRRQDSEDEEYFACIFDKALIDEEKHTSKKNPLRKSSAYSSENSTDDDFEEFGAAESTDQPNEQYLRGNESIDNITIETSNGYHHEPADRLDQEGHATIDIDLLVTSRDSEDADEFGENGETDAPDSRYLSRQDSKNEIYFDNYGDQVRLAESRRHVKLLAAQAADIAIHTPPKKKGKKGDYKKATPPRAEEASHLSVANTPCSKGTATTATALSLSPDITDSETSYADLAEMCFHDAEGEGSILNGGLGNSVYLRIKLSELESSDVKAKGLLQDALKYAREAVREANIDIGGKKYISILSSDIIGSECLLASVLFRLGYIREAFDTGKGIIIKLIELYERYPKEDCSVLFGLAGALQAIWFLRKELDDLSFGRDFALTVSSSILLEGLQYSEKYNTKSLLMWEWRGRPFLGAGTGIVGILYSLLGHSDVEMKMLSECLPQVMDIIRNAVDSLSEQKHESGNLKASIDGFEEDRSTDWVHGSPGYCLLLLKAYEVFGDMTYLNQAQSIAEYVIWPRRMQRRGLGLSRGVSGMAYTFLALARVDKVNTQMWKSRAAKMAEVAITDLEELRDMSDNHNSLFEGTGGLVCLLIDLERPPSDIAFPFFEYKESLNFKKEYVDAKESQLKFMQIDVRDCENNISALNEPGTKKDNYHPKEGEVSHNKSQIYPAESGTQTTELSTTARSQYHTPPRRTTGMAISPLTEPSPGQRFKVVQQGVATIKEVSVVAETEKNLSRQSLSSKIRPPQVKHHVYTQPDNVALANSPTQSWTAKIKSSKQEQDDNDAFTSASIERKQRAEASWFKYKLHDEPVTATKNTNDIRRMVGGFDNKVHHNPAGSTADIVSIEKASSHAVPSNDDSGMALVIEELREKLDAGEKIE